MANQKYKLVPVEPTSEMLAAGEYALEAGCYASGIYAAMLAAAPDVQGELVGWQPIETAPHGEEVLLGWLEWDGAWKMEVSQASWGWSTKTVSNISRHGQATHWMPLPDAAQSSEPLSSNPRPLSSKSSEPVAYALFADNGNIRIWCADPVQVETLRQQYGEALQPLPAAPQPADSAYVRLDKQCRQAVAAALGFPCGGDCAWSYLLQQIKDAVIYTEQQPAPDVAELVKALESIAKLPIDPCSTENDYRLSAAKAIASAAISAHRK